MIPQEKAEMHERKHLLPVNRRLRQSGGPEQLEEGDFDSD